MWNDGGAKIHVVYQTVEWFAYTGTGIPKIHKY